MLYVSKSRARGVADIPGGTWWSTRESNVKVRRIMKLDTAEPPGKKSGNLCVNVNVYRFYRVVKIGGHLDLEHE